jgi:hypothetical protein
VFPPGVFLVRITLLLRSAPGEQEARRKYLDNIHGMEVLAGKGESATTNRVVDDEENDCADDGDEHALEVEPGDARHRMNVGHLSKRGEEPASDDCANDAKNDVQRDTFSPLVDDLAAEETRDETKDDPSDYGHDSLLALELLEPTGGEPKGPSRSGEPADSKPNSQVA